MNMWLVALAALIGGFAGAAFKDLCYYLKSKWLARRQRLQKVKLQEAIGQIDMEREWQLMVEEQERQRVDELNQQWQDDHHEILMDKEAYDARMREKLAKHRDAISEAINAAQNNAPNEVVEALIDEHNKGLEHEVRKHDESG